MNLPKASLEYWMRDYYFDTPIDLGSSGVHTFSMAEVRKLTGITQEDLDDVKFDDSLTLGSMGLRKAIANRWGNGDPEMIMVANGSNEILYMILMTMLRKEDEVISLDPSYHALHTVAESKGCKMKRWKLSPENGFQPEMNDLKQLVTPKTRMITVNFPHNPTGVSISRAQQQELIQIAAEVDAYLIWDAAFEDMVDQTPLPNPCLEYNRAICTGTFSKGYGLPGLRIGWCFAPPEVLEACIDLRDYTTLYVSPLIEKIAQGVVENIDVFRDIRMKEAYHNLTIVEKWMEQHRMHVEWIRPQGGVTAFVKIINLKDTEAFCRSLAQEHGVMLVPGKCFGYPQYVRFGFGCPTQELKKGLECLSMHLNTFKVLENNALTI